VSAASHLPAALLAQRSSQLRGVLPGVEQQQRHLGRMARLHLNALHADQRLRVALVLEVQRRLACARAARLVLTAPPAAGGRSSACTPMLGCCACPYIACMPWDRSILPRLLKVCRLSFLQAI